MNIVAESRKIEDLYNIYFESKIIDKNRTNLSLSERAIAHKGDIALETIITLLAEHFTSSFSYIFKSKNDYSRFMNLKDDISSEISLWLLESIDTYRSGKGTLTGYLTSRSKWFFDDLCYKFSFDATIEDRVSYQIKAASKNFIDKYKEKNHREPTISEIKEHLYQEFYSTKADLFISKDAKLKKDSAKLDKLVKDRLSRDGIISALKNISQILTRSTTALRLEAEYLDEDGNSTTNYETISNDDLVQTPLSDNVFFEDIIKIISTNREEIKAPILSNLGVLEDIFGTSDNIIYQRSNKKIEKKAISISKLADSNSLDKSELRSIIKTSQYRIKSPLAQFAYLAN
jgi:hypothetical protein